MKLDLSVIKTLCKRKNITVKEFAEAVGVTPVGVSRSIKNNATTAEFIEKACNYFRVSPNVFFGGRVDDADSHLRALLDLDKAEIKRDLDLLLLLPQSSDQSTKAVVLEMAAPILERLRRRPLIQFFIAVSLESKETFFQLINNLTKEGYLPGYFMSLLYLATIGLMETGKEKEGAFFRMLGNLAKIIEGLNEKEKNGPDLKTFKVKAENSYMNEVIKGFADLVGVNVNNI